MSSENSTFEAYYAEFPEEIRSLLRSIATTIRKAVPEAQEKISYRMPSFHLNGPIVYFAAFKHHIGFYPTASGISRFKKELVDYTCSKGAVQFPLDKPIPFDLIRKIVLFKRDENVMKKNGK